jgi:hypothetical protein
MHCFAPSEFNFAFKLSKTTPLIALHGSVDAKVRADIFSSFTSLILVAVNNESIQPF